jgi:hypothetical protein
MLEGNPLERRRHDPRYQKAAYAGTVRARPGSLRGPSVSHSTSSLYGGFVWMRRVLNGPPRPG